MITNTALAIFPLVALAFIVAGVLLLRRSPSRIGAWLLTAGGIVFLGAEIYGVLTLRPFVGREYDERWYAQVATVEGLDAVGLVLCACGVLAHAIKLPRLRA